MNICDVKIEQQLSRTTVRPIVTKYLCCVFCPMKFVDNTNAYRLHCVNIGEVIKIPPVNTLKCGITYDFLISLSDIEHFPPLFVGILYILVTRARTLPRLLNSALSLVFYSSLSTFSCLLSFTPLPVLKNSPYLVILVSLSSPSPSAFSLSSNLPSYFLLFQLLPFRPFRPFPFSTFSTLSYFSPSFLPSFGKFMCDLFACMV